MSTPLLIMRAVSVVFGELIANDAVDLSVEAGEIHALLGENGAGKSTLMRALAGLLVPSSGEVRIDGVLMPFGSPLESMRLGVGMVHQHFMLVPTLTVAENVCLGLASTGWLFPDLKSVSAKLGELALAYGLAVDPRARIADLSIAGQQRVEILKALYRGARILVLDEPTAVLTPQEAEGLFRVLRALAENGAAIVFISHKLNEVISVTSRVTVLRRGKVVGNVRTGDANVRSLARLMVGADVDMPNRKESDEERSASQPKQHNELRDVLRVRELVSRDSRGVLRVNKASLVVSAGEIVGLAGVDGNGQQELVETIVGLRRSESGAIFLNGEDVTIAPVARRIGLGLAHIPEDRHRTALVEPLSIEDNLILESVGSEPFSKRGWLVRRAISERARELMAHFDIRAVDGMQRVGSLSGGNQQKVVLARALDREPKLVVAVQPSRGLDISATAFVHRALLARRDVGAGVLLISSELDEIMALCDRILVIFKGAILGQLMSNEATAERLGLMMAGRMT